MSEYRKPARVEPDDPPPTATPWELQTWVSKRMCPTCGVNLFGARQDGFRIDACGKCGGAWLTHAEAQRTVQQKSNIPGTLSEKAAAAAPDKQQVPEGRPCPDCGAPLVRETVPPCEVDTCKAHGTWYDAHELRAVANAQIHVIQQRESAEANAGIAQLANDAATRDGMVASAGVALGVLSVMSGRIPIVVPRRR